MKSIALCIFCFVSLHIFAQQNAYFKTLGTSLTEEGKDVVVGNNGLTYVLSSSNAQEGHSTDVMITALDEQLNCVWNKWYGWNYIESPSSLHYIEPYLYVVGSFLSTFSGTYDVFVLQIHEDGTEGWMQTFGTADWDIPKHAVLANDAIHIIVESLLNNTLVNQVYTIDEAGTVSSSFALSLDTFSHVTFFGYLNNQFVIAANTSNEELPNQTKVFFLDNEGVQLSSFDVVVEGADEVIIHDMIEKDGQFYYCGEVHSPDRIDAMYRRCDAAGITNISSILNDNGNSNYVSIAAYDDRIVLPGYTMFAGAGGKDAFVMVLSVDGFFLGAPTFGGEEDDEIYAAYHTDEGGVVAVGTGFSYNGNSGETIVLALNVANSGDYQQFIDTESDCVVVNVNDDFDTNTRIVRRNFYDMLGRELDENELSNLYIGMLYIEVQELSNGEKKTIKRLYTSGLN